MSKTYAEYVEEAKSRKFNPQLIASPEAKLPSKMRERNHRKTEKPPLDQLKNRRRVQA